jgi:glycosyltransferase involved in cell wall biosynthesis
MTSRTELRVSPRRSAVLISSVPGQLSGVEVARLAAAGERPRAPYVEFASILDADIIDAYHMTERATAPARFVARRVGMTQGQVAEAFLRRGAYRHIVAFGDRLGLPLALLFKLTRSRRDLVLISDWLTRPEKAFFLRRLKVHSHLRTIVNNATLQREMAEKLLGVPAEKLHYAAPPVDDRFWEPEEVPVERMICSVGLEARDYSTLIAAVRGLDLDVHLALGTAWLSPSGLVQRQATPPADEGVEGEVPDFRLLKGSFSYGLYERLMSEIEQRGLPTNVKFVWPRVKALRRLYARSLFVVIPVQDVENAVGSTSMAEAMAMGKAVITTRSRGQDVIQHGEQGLCVPVGDARALREAIEYLAIHPDEAARMGRAARAAVERKHALDRYLAQLVAVVEDSAAPSAYGRSILSKAKP